MTCCRLPSPGGKLILSHRHADQVRVWLTSRTRCWSAEACDPALVQFSHEDTRMTKNLSNPRVVMKEPGSHKLAQAGTSTVALSAHQDPVLKAWQMAENRSKWPSPVPARPPTQANFECGQGLWPFKNPSVFQSLTLPDAAIDRKSQSVVEVFPLPSGQQVDGR